MATIPLSISLQGNTIVVYNGNQVVNDLTVQPGDELQFTSDRMWAVQFITEGPPGNSTRVSPPVSVSGIRGGPNQASLVQISSNAVRGMRWDYVVCVVDDNGYLVTDDPDIVIAPRSGAARALGA